MTWARLREVREARSADAPRAAGPAIERRGFDPDVPEGGTLAAQQSTVNGSSRREELDQLFDAYANCAPAAASIDAIARHITAGGVVLRPKGATKEELSKLPDTVPAQVSAAQALIDYINPDQDVRQLMRNVLVSLLVAGDAFLEVTWRLGVPVALWNLDSATTTPIADEHGSIVKYVQQVSPSRRVEFQPHEVIHVQMDAPRGGLYGLSPTKKLRETITSWIWTMSLLKWTMRKGNPPRFAVAFPPHVEANGIKRFRQQFAARHLGPDNIGIPVTTQGDAHFVEFKANSIAEYLSTLDSLRDTILGGYGVPPRKAMIEEKGALGGSGAEEGQDKTFDQDTCDPIGALVMEKLNFVVLQAFGVSDYEFRWGPIDDDEGKDREAVRDMRLRNGSWTLNRYRADIDEPPVEGGDVAVLVDRQNLVAWPDMAALSRANLAAVKAKGDEPETPGGAPAQGNPGLAPLPPTVGKASEDAAYLERALRTQARLVDMLDAA